MSEHKQKIKQMRWDQSGEVQVYNVDNPSQNIVVDEDDLVDLDEMC